MDPAVYPLTLYYDASCPLCDSEMRNLMLRDTDGLLCFVDASAPGFVSPLRDVSVADLMTLLHGRRADGTVVTGVETIRLAYAAVGLGWLTAPTAWPLLRQAADLVYPWLARNRHRVPGRLAAALAARPLRWAAERAARQARCGSGVCHR